MKQPNILTSMYEARDYQKLIGYRISSVDDVSCDNGEDVVVIELVNDYGVSIDVMVSDEVMANEPHIKESTTSERL